MLELTSSAKCVHFIVFFYSQKQVLRIFVLNFVLCRLSKTTTLEIPYTPFCLDINWMIPPFPCPKTKWSSRWHPQAVGVWAWLFIWHFTMFKRSIKLQRLLNTLFLFAYKNTTLTSDVTFGPRLRMPFYFKCSLLEWKKSFSSDLR